MRFIDEATIQISGGHGGPGAVSFRREKYVPRGGPDGGDGGRGGDIVFIADLNLSTLQDFRFKRKYAAPAGNNGSGANKTGRDGETITIKVPVGTSFKDPETDEVVHELNDHGETWLACKGGRGGKGNAHFVSSTFQVPRFAQPGEEGSALKLKLELRLLADVGIVGYPNAGKSTLISKISAAKPKIADYAFTTLTPNLGVVSLPELKSFVVADIPGLIEGAHRGQGLGHRFLKHTERTRVLIHLIDGTRLLDVLTNPLSENVLEECIEEMAGFYQKIRKELGHFNPALLHKAEIVAINKIDLVQTESKLIEQVQSAVRERIISIRKQESEAYPSLNHRDEPFMISAASQQNIQELMKAVQETLDRNKMTTPETKNIEGQVTLPDGSTQSA